ncbi:DUF551 domain-containing protein [Klebsiella michiganensis]|nr:DUF551 domain-containing protein [Klebsiella michiganensis]MBE0200021.1 DUF551 domain-containing protein [Klebsiella michiganensis]
MAMAAELQERRKADSEPVAWLWSRDDERDVSLTPPEDDDDAADAIECGWTATPLYRHAQQPVVPEEITSASAPEVFEIAADCSIPMISDRWIPVSERMPKREYVLAADFSGKHYSPCQPNTQVGIYADWFDDGNPTWDDGDGNDLHLKQVTHWMPLPATPQEVQGE